MAVAIVVAALLVWAGARGPETQEERASAFPRGSHPTTAPGQSAHSTSMKRHDTPSLAPFSSALLRRRGCRTVCCFVRSGGDLVVFQRLAKHFAADRLTFASVDLAQSPVWRAFLQAEFSDLADPPFVLVLGSSGAKGAVFSPSLDAQEPAQSVQQVAVSEHAFAETRAWLERLLDGLVPLRILDEEVPSKSEAS